MEILAAPGERDCRGRYKSSPNHKQASRLVGEALWNMMTHWTMEPNILPQQRCCEKKSNCVRLDKTTDEIGLDKERRYGDFDQNEETLFDQHRRPRGNGRWAARLAT